MFDKGSILILALLVPQFGYAGPEKINFDSPESGQMESLLIEAAAGTPQVQLPPKPVVTAYGETDDGKIIKLSHADTTKDTDSDGKHYSWVPGLKSAIFDMTCEVNGSAQYTWQLRLMKPINLPQRAGHDHATGNLPAGTTYHPAPDLQTKATYYIDGQIWAPQLNFMGEALTRVLGPKSVVRISIPDPKYSTSIALPLQYSGECNGGETRYMDIMVPDLVALPASGTTYALTGGKPGVHTQTHFGTVATIAALKELAARWRTTHPDSYKLLFNDISLPWGGAFELYGDWNANHSHSNHSFGVAVDLSKKCVKKGDRPALIKLMGELGFTVLSEGDPDITDSGDLVPDGRQTHYHIQYVPEINRLLNYLIPPNNVKFPILRNGMMNGVEDQEQSDNGRGPYPALPETRHTFDCQKYMGNANNCKNPAVGSDEDKYCHCVGIFNGINPAPEDYTGCPQ